MPRIATLGGNSWRLRLVAPRITPITPGTISTNALMIRSTVSDRLESEVSTIVSRDRNTREIRNRIIDFTPCLDFNWSSPMPKQVDEISY